VPQRNNYLDGLSQRKSQNIRSGLDEKEKLLRITSGKNRVKSAKPGARINFTRETNRDKSFFQVRSTGVNTGMHHHGSTDYSSAAAIQTQRYSKAPTSVNPPTLNSVPQQFLPSGLKKGGAGSAITSIDQISPELAAQIVKSYILPMFESEDKK
jgi:hypothetical protein